MDKTARLIILQNLRDKITELTDEKEWRTLSDWFDKNYKKVGTHLNEKFENGNYQYTVTNEAYNDIHTAFGELIDSIDQMINLVERDRA